MQVLKDKRIITLIIVALTSLSFLIYFKYITPSVSPVNYETFINNLNNNEVKTVNIISDNELKVILKNNLSYTTSNPDNPNFKESLLMKGVTVSKNDTPPLGTTVSASILTLSIALMFLLLAGKGQGLGSISKLNVKDQSDKSSLNFDSVAGNEEAKESVKDIVDFLIFY